MQPLFAANPEGITHEQGLAALYAAQAQIANTAPVEYAAAQHAGPPHVHTAATGADAAMPE